MGSLVLKHSVIHMFQQSADPLVFKTLCVDNTSGCCLVVHLFLNLVQLLC